MRRYECGDCFSGLMLCLDWLSAVVSDCLDRMFSSEQFIDVGSNPFFVAGNKEDKQSYSVPGFYGTLRLCGLHGPFVSFNYHLHSLLPLFLVRNAPCVDKSNSIVSISVARVIMKVSYQWLEQV